MRSPLLFNLYIVDLEKCIEKKGIRGIKIGKNRIWLIAYAVNIVLVANNREALTDMMDTLRIFLRKRMH